MKTLKELSDKDLAGKIALKLGWHLTENKEWMSGSYMQCCDKDLEARILSGVGFDLIVNKAIEIGWKVKSFPSNVYFMNCNRFDWTDKSFLIRTGRFKEAEHGSFRSVALAFMQIPDNPG